MPGPGPAAEVLARRPWPWPPVAVVSALELLVDAAATHRLTRLVTADSITEPLRYRIVAALIVDAQGHPLTDDQVAAPDATELVVVTPTAPKLAVLLTCRWCAGMWVAGGVGLVRLVAPRGWDRAARVLACSSAAALLAAIED
jgi:hypothetical protein